MQHFLHKYSRIADQGCHIGKVSQPGEVPLMNIASDSGALSSFIGYLLVVMGLGVVAFFLTRNLSDYVLGGRRLGGAVAALSAGASDMSSWLLLGLPGAVYLSGLQQIWIPLGLIIGAYCNWHWIAKPLRIYSEIAEDSLTIPAYLDNRFKDTSKYIRGIAALAILVFFTFYVATGLVAGAVLLSHTFDLSYLQALALGTSIIMLYTLVGGFLAVSWTDFFQGTLMFVCLLIVPWFVHEYLGGTEMILNKILAYKPHHLVLSHDLGFLSTLSLLSWGLGYFGMPHILVRFMAVKSIKEIPLAQNICMGWMTLSLLGAMLTGLVGVAYFGDSPLSNHETVFMALSQKVFPAWCIGIIMAAILSSCMCAVDSQMLAASSALTEDVYRALFRPLATQQELMWMGRLAVVVIAAAAIALSLTPSKTIMDLVSFAWAGLGATFGPTVVLSLFWERMSRKGAIWGMLIGAGTVIIWRILGLELWLYSILPGSVFSLVAVVMASLLDKEPSDAVRQQFRKAHSILKQQSHHAVNKTFEATTNLEERLQAKG